MTNEEMWAGELGNKYNARNMDTQEYSKRTQFFRKIMDEYEPKKILEVGCNIGWNIHIIQQKTRWEIPWDDVIGIDVNIKAIRLGIEDGDNTQYGSATNILFMDNWFDLVFTAGVLIHIPPKELEKAMDEILRVSSKYILCIEYYALKERERPFLGQMGITWERPYNDLYTAMGLEIVEAGFLTKDDGFNDLNYWMFKKGDK